MFELKKSYSAHQLAQALGAQSIGDDILISNVAPFGKRTANSLSFCKTSVSPESNNLIIADYSLSDVIVTPSSVGISSHEPRLLFIRALEYLDKTVGFRAAHDEPEIGEGCQIGANVVLGNNVVIGSNTVIEPNVVILDNTRVGDNCLIRANATIGSDGFGFERLSDGTPVKFIHLGGVIIGNHVEIGANTCISKGTLGNTIIEDNVKIDNLVHIAHNCVLKNGAYVIACAEISGGVEVGENAWVAPNAAIRQKLTIGKDAVVGLGAVVTKNVPPQDIVAGNPAKSFKVK